MNKWKVGFFVSLVIFFISSFFLFRNATSDAIETVDKSLVYSYTIIDIQ